MASITNDLLCRDFIDRGLITIVTDGDSIFLRAIDGQLIKLKTMEVEDGKSFFDEYGEKGLLNNSRGGVVFGTCACIVEELYQAFKARLKSEQ